MVYAISVKCGNDSSKKRYWQRLCPLYFCLFTRITTTPADREIVNDASAIVRYALLVVSLWSH
jgi:hypothetical protein